MARGDHMKQYSGLQGSFSLQLEQFKVQALAAIEQTVQDVIIQIGESVINLSPVDTGRFKANWQFTVDQPSNKSLIEYDKEGSEAIGRLVAAVNTMELGQKAFIVNNLVYSIPLEYGYSKKAPSGIVRVTLAQFQSIIDLAVKANQI